MEIEDDQQVIIPQFKQIIEKLIEIKKPIILHNGTYDLLFIYQHFIQNLPNNIYEFQIEIQKYFPILLDTKTISQHIQQFIQIKTSLESLYKTLNPKQPLQYFVNFQSFDSQAQLHDAGYDSYCTGACFIAMINYIRYRNEKKKKNSNEEKIQISKNQIQQSTYDQFINKISRVDLNADLKSLNQQIRDKHENILVFQLQNQQQFQQFVQELNQFGNFKIHLKTQLIGFIEFLDQEQQFLIQDFNTEILIQNYKDWCYDKLN